MKYETEVVREATDKLYADSPQPATSLLDDRDKRPALASTRMELIGIPHRIVVSDRGLAAACWVQHRRDAQPSR